MYMYIVNNVLGIIFYDDYWEILKYFLGRIWSFYIFNLIFIV